MELTGYNIGCKIGFGFSGEVYQATRIDTKDIVAIKIQTKEQIDYICNEYEIYQSLKDGEGIPTIIELGKDKNRSWMAMELLGKSLNKLFISCRFKFSLKTVLMLADQMIHRLEFIHSRNIVHRDIKLDNFLMGINDKCKQVYLIDFGLAIRSSNEEAKEHITCEESDSLAGNSTNQTETVGPSKWVHIRQTRVGDLYSLGYVLMSTLKELHWVEQLNKTCEEITSTSLENLCRPYPKEFLTYMKYCKNLDYDNMADYSYLRKLFKDLFDRKGFTLDYAYDWTQMEEQLKPSLESHHIEPKNNR